MKLLLVCCIGWPFAVLDLLRESGDPTGLSVIVGGAYWTLVPLSVIKFEVAIGAGAGGAARIGTIGEETAPPGGRGAGRWGIMVEPFTLGEGEVGPDGRPGVLRGIGGGARGFSKLSSVFVGKRGL